MRPVPDAGEKVREPWAQGHAGKVGERDNAHFSGIRARCGLILGCQGCPEVNDDVVIPLAEVLGNACDLCEGKAQPRFLCQFSRRRHFKRFSSLDPASWKGPEALRGRVSAPHQEQALRGINGKDADSHTRRPHEGIPSTGFAHTAITSLGRASMRQMRGIGRRCAIGVHAVTGCALGLKETHMGSLSSTSYRRPIAPALATRRWRWWTHSWSRDLPCSSLDRNALWPLGHRLERRGLSGWSRKRERLADRCRRRLSGGVWDAEKCAFKASHAEKKTKEQQWDHEGAQEDERHADLPSTAGR